MGNYVSKFSLNQKVKFIINDVIFVGKIIGITFIDRGTFYDIDANPAIYKSVEEDYIESL